jgi:hypothetical protein
MPSPSWLIAGLLLAECLLWLSEQLGWPEWQKNDAVLICAGMVAAAIAVLLLWWLAALLFRWRFQFGIRALLVLVLAVALPCSWLAVAMKQAKQQAIEVEALCNVGAAVREDYVPIDPATIFDPNDPFTTDEELALRHSIRGRIRWVLLPVVAPAFFSNVLEVEGVAWVPDGRKLGDEDLAYLREFPRLEILNLSKSLVTDAGMRELRGLRHLRGLYLSSTKITDAGLEPLSGLVELETLDLSKTRIDDAGLAHLAGLARLKLLLLNWTDVSDAGMKCLSGLSRLESLSLIATQVGNAGLQELAGLPRLNKLNACGTMVDENGVARLHARTIDFSTLLTAANRKAICSVLGSDPKYHKLMVVHIEPAEGGGARVDLAEPPNYFGPCLLMKKKDGAWRIDKVGSWFGEGELPSAGQGDDQGSDQIPAR